MGGILRWLRGCCCNVNIFFLIIIDFNQLIKSVKFINKCIWSILSSIIFFNNPLIWNNSKLSMSFIFKVNTKKKIGIFQFDGNTKSCLLLNFKTKEFQIILLCHVEDYKILITWISKRHQTTVSVIIWERRRRALQYFILGFWSWPKSANEQTGAHWTFCKVFFSGYTTYAKKVQKSANSVQIITNSSIEISFKIEFSYL